MNNTIKRIKSEHHALRKEYNDFREGVGGVLEQWKEIFLHEVILLFLQRHMALDQTKARLEADYAKMYHKYKENCQFMEKKKKEYIDREEKLKKMEKSLDEKIFSLDQREKNLVSREHEILKNDEEAEKKKVYIEELHLRKNRELDIKRKLIEEETKTLKIKKDELLNITDGGGQDVIQKKIEERIIAQRVREKELELEMAELERETQKNIRSSEVVAPSQPGPPKEELAKILMGGNKPGANKPSSRPTYKPKPVVKPIMFTNPEEDKRRDVLNRSRTREVEKKKKELRMKKLKLRKLEKRISQIARKEKEMERDKSRYCGQLGKLLTDKSLSNSEKEKEYSRRKKELREREMRL